MFKYGAIQEYKKIKLMKKDKMDGYGDLQAQHLTKHADDEYGIVFAKMLQ